MIDDLLAKLRVIAKSGITLLTAVVVIVTTISPVLPEDWQTIAANVAVGLTAAITAVRRHTPAAPSARGILPRVHKEAK